MPNRFFCVTDSSQPAEEKIGLTPLAHPHEGLANLNFVVLLTVHVDPTDRTATVVVADFPYLSGGSVKELAARRRCSQRPRCGRRTGLRWMG